MLVAQKLVFFLYYKVFTHGFLVSSVQKETKTKSVNEIKFLAVNIVSQ